MRIMIIGGSRLGGEVARRLREDGHEITLFEEDAKAAEALAEDLDIAVINADGTDVDELEDAGLMDMEVFMALTGSDETNLMACEIAKIKGVGKVIARANRGGDRELFEKLGVDVVLTPASIAATAFRDAVIGGVKTVCVLEEDFEIVEHIIEEGSIAAGKRIRELGFPRESRVLIIYRDGKGVIPYGDTSLKAGDKILVLTRRKNLEELLSHLTS